MKRQGQPIAVLTAYDAPTARAEAAAGVDIILVGDSVGTNMLGYTSEREVTMADMIHHTQAVRRGAPDTFIASDLPYNSYSTSELAVANARQLIKAGADIVKFEGFYPQIVETLARAEIGAFCHLGLEPQHHEEKRLKGRSAEGAIKLVEEAMVLEKAGMTMLLLELIPEEVGETVTQSIKVPTIGIGAGRKTDGQVLVICDILGFTTANFRHNRRYQEVSQIMESAARSYVLDVQGKFFPAEANAFHMSADELVIFRDHWCRDAEAARDYAERL
jgi:3-methyl-2-oxobutanoate hydroxymethyltransferase